MNICEMVINSYFIFVRSWTLAYDIVNNNLDTREIDYDKYVLSDFSSDQAIIKLFEPPTLYNEPLHIYLLFCEHAD